MNPLITAAQAEARGILAQKCTQYGGSDTEPTKLRTDQVIETLEDIVANTFEKGVAAERERITKIISNLIAFYDRDTPKAQGARYGLTMLLEALTPPN